MVSRADKGVFAEWWWTVDKLLLIASVLLMIGGLVLSLSASPAIAERIGVDGYHFVVRHAIFLLPALVILLLVSLMDARQARRASLVLLGAAIVLMITTMFFGYEAKGARRWLDVGGFSIQPSEFLKPSFVVVAAWLFAENTRRPDIPGNLFSIILFLIVAALLVAQPDFGQTTLLTMVWAGMFFMAGMPWLLIVVFAAVASAALFGAYMTVPHVASRIDRFLTGAGDTFQVDAARDAFVGGGWLGLGPGEGVVKRYIPDGHTDFAFAVLGEEFGIAICIAMVAVFAFIVMRGLSHALRENNAFVRLAICGLILLFGLQSIINMAVNVQLMPAKGMTLPFVSYGGSSMMAVAFGMGLILALTRKRPDQRRFAQDDFAPSGMQAAA